MGRRYTSTVPAFHFVVQLSSTQRKTITNEGAHVSPSSIAIPLAELGVPIPYVVGTQRILAPQIWWYGNLRPIIQEHVEVFTETDVVKFKPPLLLFWREETITKETIVITRTIVGYNLSMQFGVCLGPDALLRAIYVDEEKIWEGEIGPGRTEFTIPENDTFLNGDCIWSGGSFTQSPDTYLDGFIDSAQLPGYVGMAHLIIKDVRADKIQGRVSFEVSRFPNRLSLSSANNRSGDDINIGSAIADFIASDWGGAGAGTDILDIAGTFTESAERLATENNFCSVVLTQESDTSTVLKSLIDQADAILFEDPTIEKVKLRLIRFDQLSPLSGITLDDRNVSRISDWDRESWVGSANKARVTFTSRAKGYDLDSMIGYNFAAINDRIKANRTLHLDFPACMTGSVAQSLLSYNLGLYGKPLVRATIETNRRPSATLPGDTVRLFVPGRGLGPVLGVATKVQRFPMGDNRTLITMQQVARQSNDIVFDKDDDSLGDDFNVQIDPPDAVNVMQAPYWLARRKGATFSASQTVDDKFVLPIILPTRADNVQASFGAYIVNHPETTGQVQIVQNAEYPTVAELDDAIGQYDGIDTGEIALIDISSVLGGEHLQSLGETGVRQGHLLLLIDDEILGFETATDNSDGTWTLSNVHRGLIDTVPQAHAIGATVYVIGNTSSYMGSALEYPLGYVPTWRITSNTVSLQGDPTNVNHYLVNGVWDDLSSARLHPPIRPHNTKVDALDRSSMLTNELGEEGLIVVLGESLAVTWRTRHKAEPDISLQLDAAEDAEIDDSDPDDPLFTIARVLIRDRNGTLRDCGATADDTTYNSLASTVPATTALGLGALFVRTENTYGNSLFEDQLPVYVLDDGYYVREQEDEYYISEDGSFLYVGEGT